MVEGLDAGWWIPAATIASLLVGLGIGVVVGRVTSPALAEAKRLREELDRTVEQHQTYRTSVNSHFRKTADLVGKLTQSYAAVYDHLATGAQRFCEEGEDGDRLPFGPLPGALGAPDAVEDGAGPADAGPLDADAVDADSEPVEAATDRDLEDEPAAAESVGDGDDWPTDVAVDDGEDSAIDTVASDTDDTDERERAVS